MAFKMKGWSAFTKDDDIIRSYDDLIEKDGKLYDKHGVEVVKQNTVMSGSPPNPAKALWQMGKGVYEGGKWLYDKLKK
tara:strand:- start:78 stop:311 length:234 start_codon:yes stop_codon:yes gene_type:complete